jgi:acyl carrier protein phosphodiesterase
MNFLAHLYLTDVEPAMMVGGLLPDLVRGPVPRDLSPAVAAGVANHRRVDAFTDTHPCFHRSRARLRQTQGIFAGILVDVFYDHFLSVGWDRLHPEPRERFIDRAHCALRDHAALTPPPMRPIVRRLIDQRWLTSYASFEGLRLTLARMSTRFAERFERDIDLTRALPDLQTHYDDLAHDFARFFPALVDYIGIDHRPADATRAETDHPPLRTTACPSTAA